MKTFAELGLHTALLQAIEEQGYVNPMPIQEAVIPFLIGDEGAQGQEDLVALAQTGTGKTAAYGLPLLHQMVSDETLRQGHTPEALILSPTRELCLQIADDLNGFARHIEGLEILAVYGGANIEPQIRALKHGVDIIVATPGRLIDLIRRGAARLDDVRYIILDEADEMLSMGFQDDIDTIFERLPEDHRTLLFSATMSREIERIAQKYLHEAREIQVGSRNEGAENVNHIYYMVHAKDKYLALKRLVDFYPKIYAIIFCRTRMETQEIADNLIRDGYNADALHGDLSQQQRDLTMQKFRQHRTQLLVATDVAARGLDVDDLTHVINFGMPDDVENYTHRSGRTGRAGKKGTSLSIVNVRERSKIRLVEKTIQKEFVKGTLPAPKEICSKQLYHVIDEIERVEVDEDEVAQFLPEVKKRWEWLDKDDLIQRIISREFSRFLQYYANAPEIEDVAESKPRQKGDKGQAEGFKRLFITLGKMDGFFAKEMIKLIDQHTHQRINIGRIDLMKNYSFVEVAEEEARDVIMALKGLRVKGRTIDIEEAAPDTRSPLRARDKGPAKRAEGQPPRGKADKTGKPSREERGYTAPRGKKYTKDDWMKFVHPEKAQELNGPEPDFSEEGWARRFPKKK